LRHLARHSRNVVAESHVIAAHDVAGIDRGGPEIDGAAGAAHPFALAGHNGQDQELQRDASDEDLCFHSLTLVVWSWRRARRNRTPSAPSTAPTRRKTNPRTARLSNRSKNRAAARATSKTEP